MKRDLHVGRPLGGRTRFDSRVHQPGHHWTWADLHAWEILRPLLDAGGYLPWTEGAMSPAGLAAVCNEIVFTGPSAVVELGSGISTIVIARLLRERGGRIDSVEHLASWADLVRGQLERERLDDLATVIEAPLRPHPLGRGGAPWYDEPLLEVLPPLIDLLLIDGPPGYGDGMSESRYPALPVLAERLSPDCVVVLDDADRPGEEAILDAWATELSFTFARLDDSGIAIGRRADPVD
jgi:predicted O-methyltransferase YrrM